MTVSVFDLFTIGIGPSSSHTVGPMRAAFTFARSVEQDGLLDRVAGIRAELFGSLGATGHGHGSVPAIVLGLSGQQPETVDPAATRPLVTAVRATGGLMLLGRVPVPFNPDEDIVLHRRKRLEFHSNAMRFAALDAAGTELVARTYYSVGGGFVLGEDEAGRPAIVADPTPVPYPFASGAELLAITRQTGLPVSGVMLANELVRRDRAEVEAGLLAIWDVMQECVVNGCAADGVLPGGLKVRRRAKALQERLEQTSDLADPL
jgi:L-serine dehydratase